MMRARLCGRINIAVLVLAATLTLSAASSGWSLGFEYTSLDERTFNRLPEEAQEAYVAFEEAADRINYDVAMEELNVAVEAAPQSMELRFLAIRLAKYHGQMHTGVDAVKYLDMALAHAKAVMEIPNLPKRQISRAQYEIERLDKQRNTVGQRDEARRTYGLQIARQYAKEVFPQSDKSAEVKAFQDAVNQLTAGGKSPAALAAARALSGTEGVEDEGAEESEVAPSSSMMEGAAPAEAAPAAEEAPAEVPDEAPAPAEPAAPAAANPFD